MKEHDDPPSHPLLKGRAPGKPQPWPLSPSTAARVQPAPSIRPPLPPWELGLPLLLGSLVVPFHVGQQLRARAMTRGVSSRVDTCNLGICRQNFIAFLLSHSRLPQLPSRLPLFHRSRSDPKLRR